VTREETGIGASARTVTFPLRHGQDPFHPLPLKVKRSKVGSSCTSTCTHRRKIPTLQLRREALSKKGTADLPPCSQGFPFNEPVVVVPTRL
jgi:hypothetical protein